MTAVGYGTDRNGVNYWVLKNSFGPNWGIGGYMLLRRGTNECGIGNESFFPFVATPVNP